MACEDYPCCGHEAGDCEGLKYGSDESIKAQVERDWRNGHGHCDHENGIYDCEYDDDEAEDEDAEPPRRVVYGMHGVGPIMGPEDEPSLADFR